MTEYVEQRFSYNELMARADVKALRELLSSLLNRAGHQLAVKDFSLDRNQLISKINYLLDEEFRDLEQELAADEQELEEILGSDCE